MDIELIITTSEKLDKTSLIQIGKIVNNVFGEKLIGGKGKKICSCSQDHDGHHHTFEFQFENNEDVCDVLASELYNKLTFDFELQIDCDINEDYLEPSDDTGILLIDKKGVSHDHSQWVSECISEGWKYGGDYDANRKTSPFLKPYHTLSETQKKVLIKSKEKMGVHGIDEDVLRECYGGK